MKLTTISAALFTSSTCAFTLQNRISRQFSSLFVSAEASTITDPLGLPTQLRKITDAFASVPDAQLRHKQLLYMANLLPKMDPSKCTPENKVPGCLSTVFIDGTATWSDEKQANVIDFVGESDGLLTKGLVALLIRYVSPCTSTGTREEHLSVAVYSQLRLFVFTLSQWSIWIYFCGNSKC